MKKYWLLPALPLVLLLWWGLSRGGSAPVVHFVAARSITIESTVATNGKVEPAQWAAARAETAGVVRSVTVVRGQEVSAGQPLVTLDSAAAESDLTAAKAREQEARIESSTVGQGGKPASVASINASISAAQALVAVAQRNFASMQRLQSQQAATKLQVDESRDALERAKVQLGAAENQRRTLVTSGDQTVAEAKLTDARATVRLAQHRLSLEKIVAPISGTVYQFDLKVGSYLQPGDLVALVGDVDQMKAVVYVDEPDLGRVGRGMPVNITWEARPGQIWAGTVDHLPTEVVALQSRTVGEVTTVIKNPNHDLLPGVTVNATVIAKIVKDTPAIPKAALRTMNGQNGVFKLVGDKLEWTAVQSGISDINNVQVLSGIREGDYVADRVVDPSDAEIASGMRVKPRLN